MNHIVSGCNSCPMNNKQYDGWGESECNHPRIFGESNRLSNETTNYKDGESPEHCPLKKENLTIVFDDKN